MKETNVKRLHTAWFQLHDSWKKQNYRNSKKTNGCLGLGADGQREGWTEQREVLLLWNCFVWPYRGGCCCLVTQTCAILCDLTDCSLPGSSVYGISQARTLGWVASFFSRGSSHPGIEPVSPAWAGGFFTAWATRENRSHLYMQKFRQYWWGVFWCWYPSELLGFALNVHLSLMSPTGLCSFLYFQG